MNIKKANQIEKKKILERVGVTLAESMVGNIETNQEKAMELLSPIINDGGYYLVATENDRIMGWILIGKLPDYLSEDTVGFIGDLYVDAEFRGKQIGKKLMQAAFEEFKKEGYKRVQLNVYAGNSAIKLYEEMGFEVVSIFMEAPL